MLEIDANDNFVSIPRTFFITLLPNIVDLEELKLVLCVAWLAGRDSLPGIGLSQLRRPEILRILSGSDSPVPAEQRLQVSLQRAVANGHLIRLTAQNAATNEHIFLLPTDEGRTFVERLGRRDAGALAMLGLPMDASIALYRPNVFSVYERHIGPLTPLIAERIRDAERSYSHEWIEDAILEAVHSRSRTWRYVQAVLTRWETTGRTDGRMTRSDES